MRTSRWLDSHTFRNNKVKQDWDVKLIGLSHFRKEEHLISGAITPAELKNSLKEEKKDLIILAKCFQLSRSALFELVRG